MSVSHLNPDVWMTFMLEKVPAALGTTIYRWAVRPLADAGAWKEGRVCAFGPISRRMSTPDGDYDVATCDVTVSDNDGLIRGLLADPTTRIMTGREAAIELLSESGRAAGATPRTLLRGRVSDVQAPIGRKAKLRIADTVGSQFSGFDLEKTVGVPITQIEHPKCPAAVVNRIYPIVLGEHSDVGAVDENGNGADKGLLPVVDVGDYMVGEDGTIYTDDVIAPAYLTAPSNLQATVNGTPGTASNTWAVTALSNYGETTAGTLTVTNCASSLSATNSVALSWTAVSGAIEYRVYRNGKLVQRLNNGETFTSPETSWTDEGAAAGAVAPPETNTAQIERTYDGQTVFGWGRLICKIGALAELHHLYASDLAAGASPRRVRVSEDRYGSEFLVPGRGGWPHADPFIEINGIRMGVIYARGEALRQHRAGAVTIAWNGCGDEENGDGSGETITEAFLGLQHLLNEYGLKDGGVGYRTGSFGPLETYSNGVEKLKSSAFADAQAMTVEWIGGRGYQLALAITEPLTLREVLRRFAVTFSCYYGPVNHHGQFYPFLIDDSASTDVGRLYHERLNIAAAVDQKFEHDQVMTRIVGHYDWDTDAQKFRVTDQVFEDEAATKAYKNTPRDRSQRQCYYTRDAATFTDSMSRHLVRYKVAPRFFSWRTDLTGLHDETGAQVRVTHYEGAGGPNGDVETPFVITEYKLLLDEGGRPEGVILTGWDLQRMLTTAAPLLGDKTTIAGNLYDKTNPNEPTAGAYELR